MTVFLVHAAHVKQVPGRKTDKAEARWWATLRRDGLLNARVIPPVGPRDRRDLTRYRTKLVQERGREDNRVHGVVERANITLGAVATHMFGGSGRAISAALLEGRVDPATRAALARGRLRSQIPLREQALTGLVWDHHRRVLSIQLAHLDFLDEPLEALSDENARVLTELSGGSPRPPRPTPPTPPALRRRSPPTDSQGPLTCARAVSVLGTMPGVDPRGRSCGWRRGGRSW